VLITNNRRIFMDEMHWRPARAVGPAHRADFESFWNKALIETHIAEVDRLIEATVEQAEAYRDAWRSGSERGELETIVSGLEMSAYVATERLAQLCAGGINWRGSDKVRYLSPSIDFMQLITDRTRKLNDLDIQSDRYRTAIRHGSWDFVEVGLESGSWKEAMEQSASTTAYLLWSARQAVRLLGSDERVPGFTDLALEDPQILSEYRRCRRPLDAALYMYLVAAGFTPPTLQVDFSSGNQRFSLAIPDRGVGINCDTRDVNWSMRALQGSTQAEKEDWTVLSFTAFDLLIVPDACLRNVIGACTP
jgi:hypothetical protein